jgi:hypothetical protein
MATTFAYLIPRGGGFGDREYPLWAWLLGPALFVLAVAIVMLVNWLVRRKM